MKTPEGSGGSTASQNNQSTPCIYTSVYKYFTTLSPLLRGLLFVSQQWAKQMSLVAENAALRSLLKILHPSTKNANMRKRANHFSSFVWLPPKRSWSFQPHITAAFGEFCCLHFCITNISTRERQMEIKWETHIIHSDIQSAME